MAKKLYKRIFRLLRDIISLRTIVRLWHNFYEYRTINGIIKKSGKIPFIYASDYDLAFSVLVQRPNHMLPKMAQKNYICIGTHSGRKTLKLSEDFYVVPHHTLYKLIQADLQKVLNISFGFPYDAIQDIESICKKTDVIVYELIDDFDLLEDINIINKAIALFKKVSQNESAIILVSAHKLLDLAISLGVPRNRVFFSKNAANFEDFKIDASLPTPEALNGIVKKKKTIVGYYGAITASWFDFELFESVLVDKPDCEFVLIGAVYHDSYYDDSCKKLEILNSYSNFTYISAVPYKELPMFARHFTVATIPFKVNQITEATNPVKLFEYMSLSIPIVCTALKECSLYKSSLIAKDSKEFSKCIDDAIRLKNDNEYLAILKKEALENTWQSRVDQLDSLIKNKFIDK